MVFGGSFKMSYKFKISAENKEKALDVAKKRLNSEEGLIEIKEVFGNKENLKEFEIYLNEGEEQKEIEQKVNLAKENLKKILVYFGVLDFELETKLDGNLLIIDIKADGLDFLVEEEGKILNAVQYIVVLITNYSFENYLKIVLDYKGFRERRTEKIKELAKKLIERVKEKNKEVALEPMNPFERRVVHSYVSTFEGVYSKSVGVEPMRNVVIYPKEENIGEME